MNETKETLEILKEKSRSFKNSINKITEAGYTLKTQTKFRMFDDVDSSIKILKDNGEEAMKFTPKGFETTLIFADNEDREIRIDIDLISKTPLDKLKADELGTLQMALIVMQTERMNLDFLKINTRLVEYSKGWESFDRTSLRDLEKQIEELSHF
jgi:hypothetical protein